MNILISTNGTDSFEGYQYNSFFEFKVADHIQNTTI